jgi:hypothetical protein
MIHELELEATFISNKADSCFRIICLALGHAILTAAATCTSTLYNETGACAFQWRPTHPSLQQLQLQVAVQKCPGAAADSLPYISISCGGDMCGQMFQPCHIDSDW